MSFPDGSTKGQAPGEVEGFVDPKHDEGRRQFPQALKDGHQEHRIIPPIHSAAATGTYHKGWAIHYGAEKKYGEKTIPLPFLCVEEITWVNGEKQVVQKCPACEQIKVAKNKDTVETAKLKDAGKSPEEISETLKGLRGWLKKYNRSYQEYLNVKDSAGKYFTTKYPSKDVWKKIKDLIEKYSKQARPIDAVKANQGLWFDIGRSGKGIGTDYTVEVVMEDVVHNGETFQRPKTAPLTPDDAVKAKAACMDLNDLGFKVLSVEEVAYLVKEKYSADAVKKLWNAPKKNDDDRSEQEESNAAVRVANAAAAAKKAEIDRAEEAARLAFAEASVAQAKLAKQQAQDELAKAAPKVEVPAPAADIIKYEMAALKAKYEALLAKAEAGAPKAAPLTKPESSTNTTPPTPKVTKAPDAPVPAPAPVASSSEEDAFLAGLDDFKA